MYKIINIINFIIMIMSVHGLSLQNVPVAFNQNLVENPRELFEGDMAGIDPAGLTFIQGSSIFHNGLVDSEYHWKDGKIPYIISDNFEHSEKTQITQAMEGFHTQTCIRFIERTSQTDYISIVASIPRGGCWTYVGYLPGRNHTVALEKNGCLTYGTIQHELMHVIGFFHEQSRLDRDNYVTIIWDNIQGGKENVNFQKYLNKKTDAFDQPYDFGSLMHYGNDYMALNKSRPTIEPKPNDQGIQLGNTDRLSQIDIIKINLMYKCIEVTSTSPRTATTTTHTTTAKPIIRQIKAGGKLAVNETLWSSDGRSKFVMQPDGNAVTYRMCDGKPMWATDTNTNTNWIGNKPTAVELNAEGHLEMYNSNKTLLWSTQIAWSDARDSLVKTAGNFTGSVLKMDNDGSLCLWKNQKCLWKSGGRGTSSCQLQPSPTFANAKVILRSGNKLKKGETVWSAKRTCKLTFKYDGDLVLKQLCPNSGLEMETFSLRHGIGRAKNVGFKEKRGEELIMRSDGELVLNGPGDNMLWNTGIQMTYTLNETTGSELRLGDDCEMCVYKSGACLMTVHSIIRQCPAVMPVVELVGWKENGSDGKIILENYALNSRICLTSCQDKYGCRFVSYNHNTKSCEGFSGTANPSFSRHIDFSIMRATEKKLYPETGVDYGNDDIQIVRNVFEGEICKQLCTIHPKCNVATYGTDDGSCYLKSKTNLNRTKFDPRISYIS